MHRCISIEDAMDHRLIGQGVRLPPSGANVKFKIDVPTFPLLTQHQHFLFLHSLIFDNILLLLRGDNAQKKQIMIQ